MRTINLTMEFQLFKQNNNIKAKLNLKWMKLYLFYLLWRFVTFFSLFFFFLFSIIFLFFKLLSIYFLTKSLPIATFIFLFSFNFFFIVLNCFASHYNFLFSFFFQPSFNCFELFVLLPLQLFFFSFNLF